MFTLHIQQDTIITDVCAINAYKNNKNKQALDIWLTKLRIHFIIYVFEIEEEKNRIPRAVPVDKFFFFSSVLEVDLLPGLLLLASSIKITKIYYLFTNIYI